MPKFWKYSIGDLVYVNENIKGDITDCIGKIGIVEDLHKGIIYDYIVKFENGNKEKFKEDELSTLKRGLRWNHV